ncbi:MAG: tetratricopeptide repeat protein [Bacteroidales bacterium]|nr:tetratricopeptide repeat protein [Bacteroidales bacterium]
MTNRFKKQFLIHFIQLTLVILSVLLIRCSNADKQKDRKYKKSAETVKVEITDYESDSIIRSVKIDSLINILETATHDTVRLSVLDVITQIVTEDSVKAIYNEKIDSIVHAVLSKNPTEDVKDKCLKYQANVFFQYGQSEISRYEFEKALDNFNKTIKLCEQINDQRCISNAVFNKGNTYYYLGDIPKAIECYEKSLKISEETDDKESISKSLNNIGIMYADLDEIPKAIEYYKKSLKVQEEINDKGSIANTLNNIGVTYSYQGDMMNALEYYMRCLKIKEEHDDKKGISAALNNIGTIYHYEEDYPAALEYLFRSLQINEEIGDSVNISGTLTNIGNIYADQAAAIFTQNKAKSDSLYQLALNNYKKAIKIQEKIGDKMIMAETLVNIGTIYKELAAIVSQQDKAGSESLIKTALEQYNRSLKISEEIGDKSSISFALYYIGDIYNERNEKVKALAYAKESYEIAKEAEYTFNIRSAAELLDKIYSSLGNFELSRKYYGEYISMRDSIIKKENQQLVQKKYFQYQYEKKSATDSIAHNKEMEIVNLEIEKKNAESKRQKMVIIFVIVGLLLVLAFAIYYFRSLRTTRKQKGIIEEQKKQVDEKNIILNEQNEEIRSQKEHIENIHEELTDSIRYAKRIQKAVLPSDEYIVETVRQSQLSPNDYFILYKPRDIVSGDFYFFGKKEDILYIAVADCTGHGVPGAFMSMLGVSFLNQIISKKETLSASQVLNELRDSIIQSLQQKGIEGEQKDGMDMTFVAYETKKRTIQYAGANNPLYIISNDTKELNEIKPDRMPVAISEEMRPFTNHVLKLKKGDIIYLTSDGYEDQFGGPRAKKFLPKRLRQLLIDNGNKPMAEQKVILDKTIEDWKSGYEDKHEQTDDITIVGVKIA